MKPHLVACVQGDTSTTMLQPLDEIGREICRAHGALFYTDATASLGGNPFEMDAGDWMPRPAGLQKCLGGPSGSAPISLSDRAVGVVRSRARVEAGIREEGDAVASDFIRSNYFDLAMILDYWDRAAPEPPHRGHDHALTRRAECARVLLLEGRDATIHRHRLHGDAMLAGVEGLGLTVFGDVAHKMTNIVAVEIPDGVVGDAVRAELLSDFGIEIGTSFGPLHGRGVAHRHDGVQRAHRRGAHDARRSRGGAASSRCGGAGRRGASRRRRGSTGPPDDDASAGCARAHRVGGATRDGRCEELARVSSMTGGIERVYLSPEHAGSTASPPNGCASWA